MKKTIKAVVSAAFALSLALGAFAPVQSQKVSALKGPTNLSYSGFVDIYLRTDSNGYKHYERLLNGQHYSYWMTR